MSARGQYLDARFIAAALVAGTIIAAGFAARIAAGDQWPGVLRSAEARVFLPFAEASGKNLPLMFARGYSVSGALRLEQLDDELAIALKRSKIAALIAGGGVPAIGVVVALVARRSKRVKHERGVVVVDSTRR